MDMSKSFTETREQRQKSLNLAAQRAAEKKGGRMLSLNPETMENSLIEMDEEELEAIERK
jgi:hypothetical protein